MRQLLPLLSFSAFLSFSNPSAFGQSDIRWNNSFEQVSGNMPVGWSEKGSDGYRVEVDSTNVKSGKYAVSVTSPKQTPKGTTARYLVFSIPESYAGNFIVLSGYIKTENVSKGDAGLWIRIDPQIAYKDMDGKGVTGTSDWTRFEIRVRLNPKKTEKIHFGGYLIGSGKMWLDDLSLSIDGTPIEQLKPLAKEVFTADLDKEFDAGSGIASISTDQMTYLKQLGMIWGFCKYYHPEVAAGKYNWDYELFRVLPKVMDAKNPEQFSEIMVDWIRQHGPISNKTNSTSKANNVKLTPDLKWMNNSGFSTELITTLLNVMASKRSGKNYYMDFMPGIGNPVFLHENGYSSMLYPDAGFRLLAVYRLWNIIQYYFPYKNLIEEDWAGVLGAFIPKVLSAKNELEYDFAISELIGHVHDSHAIICGGAKALENYLGNRYAAVEVQYIQNELVVTGFHTPSEGTPGELKIGDVITAIDGKLTPAITLERLPITPASNYPTQLRNIALDVMRSNDTKMTIDYQRNGQNLQTDIPTFAASDISLMTRFFPNDTCFRMLTPDIAYINNGPVAGKDLPAIWKVMEHSKGLVIDCRNYPSDYVLFELCKYLMPGLHPFVKFATGSNTQPGLFTFTKDIKVGVNNGDGYQGKVAILVNENSQSSAEYHAMAYRIHPNAVVVGSTTAGADGNVSDFALPGGIKTRISGVGVYYPDGGETQRIGIVPDVEVKPTIQGVREGRDEVLEKAIEVINGK